MSRTVEHREVVVIGGGPAGSATAAYLARAGHDVLLLERAQFQREKACSELTSPGLWHELTLLGAEKAYLGAGPALIGTTRIVTTSGFELPLSYSGLLQPGASASSMLRSELDALLLDHARGQGVEVRHGWRAVPVVGRGECTGVVATAADGRSGEVRARLTVGADGLQSVVARTLGGRRALLWPRRLGLSAHYEGVDWSEQVCEMHVGEWTYAGISPTSGGLTSVGLGIDLRRTELRGVRPEELFAAALVRFPAVQRRLERARVAGRIRGVGPMAYRVERLAGPGWALVGDAAGFVDPFTGEGIYRAVRGARLLAEVYSAALRGREANPARVYADERRQVFLHKAVVVRLIQLFISYPALLEYVAPRLAGRPEAMERLTAVLADCAPARFALRPSFVVAALRP